MKGRAVSSKFDCAKDMPPLRHSAPGEPFDIEDSEVARWLCSQPSIMQYVFDKVSSCGKGMRFIEYDPATGLWEGVGR